MPLKFKTYSEQWWIIRGLLWTAYLLKLIHINRLKVTLVKVGKIIMNIVIENEHWSQDLETVLFAGEPTQHINEPFDMFDLLVLAGIFTSKKQARKNWTMTGQEIPLGFNQFTVGKKRKDIWIWKPIVDSE